METLDEIIALIVHRVHHNRRTHKIMNFEYSNSCRQIDFESYLNQKKENLKVIETFIKNGQKEGVFSKNVDINLITPTILGTYFHFYYNKKYYKTLLNLDDDVIVEHFVHNELTHHIQNTIKALLTYVK